MNARTSAFARVALAAGALLAAGRAGAAPTFEYRITGEYVAPPSADLRLEDTSFIIRASASSTNGSQEISPPGPFDIVRTEIFSDPDVTPSPILYSSLETFGYYGLARTYDEFGAPAGRTLFVAVPTGTGAGAAFSDVFADFLSAHPGVTMANFVQAVDDGPDFPTPGTNQLAIDIISYVIDNPATFGGDIQTTFQTGQTLDLVAFDNTTGFAQEFGIIHVEGVPVPEPAAISLAAFAGVGVFARRRRR